MGQATRRRSATTAATLAAVIALVACGTQVVTGKPTMEPGPAKLAPPTPAGVDAFTIAVRGDCLTWPEQRPDLSSIADCSEPHRFEVSERASWDAGSRQVACRIGAVTDTGWATLLNSAKDALLIDGRPPAP